MPSQESLTDQMVRLHRLAVQHRLYYADDWLLRNFNWLRPALEGQEDGKPSRYAESGYVDATPPSDNPVTLTIAARS